MSFVSTKGIYHVALDGVGLLLQGAPDRMAYRQQQAPVYGQRFASGDRDYNDLSQWWYFIQTDWSGGFKDTIAWANDAKYYYSTNIDTWSEPGGIKLARDPVSDEDFSETIYCGALAGIGTGDPTVYQFVGTGDDGSSRPHVYRASIGQGNAWTDVSTTTIDTNQNIVSQVSGRNGTLYVSTVGVGATDVVLIYDGTTWTDCSATINGFFTYQMMSSRCHCHYQGTTYVFGDNSINGQYGLVKTSTRYPSGANWSLEFEKVGVDGLPVACIARSGYIYYLVNSSFGMELYKWDIANNVDTLLRVFPNASSDNWGMGDKLLVDLNGTIIVTIPSREVWSLSSSDVLTRLWVRDDFKNNNISSSLAVGYLYGGAVVSENKVWWGNLMYDGVGFHNTWRPDDDSTNLVKNLYVDSADRIIQKFSNDESIIYMVHPSNWSNYKGATDNANYIIFNNFDNVAGVDKIAFSLTLLFKPLASGQSIEIEYFLGEMVASPSWVSLGTASATLDGTTVRDKTFFFGTSVIFKKIWFRVKLEAGGSDTPTLNDVVMEYLPVPTYKKLWVLRVNCADELKRLDGQDLKVKARELRGRLEVAWWTKALLDFQDFDYATTTVSDNPLSSSNATITVPSGGTRDFPEQGRLRIEDEEIFYTGKTNTTFTGCTRGARGTRAASHVQNTVINNAYKVLVTELSNEVPIALEGKELEYVTQITIRES